LPTLKTLYLGAYDEQSGGVIADACKKIEHILVD
jgi:hypothetical protein